MKKIKILAIAPYEELKNTIQYLAQQRDDIELEAYVSYMLRAKAEPPLYENSEEIIEHIKQSDADIMISRGNTAERLKTLTSVPVIDISISYYDMLRIIQLAQNYSGRFAVVGFPAITECASLICSLLHYNTDIYTIHKGRDVYAYIDDLYKKRYSLIIGDVITVNLAKLRGINGILVTSSKESIEASFNQAVTIYNILQTEKRKSNLYKDILFNNDNMLFVFDKSSNPIYSNFTAEDNAMVSLHVLLQKYINKTIMEKDIIITKIIGGCRFFVHGKGIICGGNKYALFYVQKTIETPKFNNSVITYKNLNDFTPDMMNKFYGGSKVMEEIITRAKKFCSTPSSILISGEKGTGKDTFASIIYTMGNFRNKPFMIVDCELISDKNWDYLLEDENTPLSISGHTIYFKNLQSLSLLTVRKLMYYITNTSLCIRNKIVFSYKSCFEYSDGFLNLLEYLRYTISCLAIELPSLQSRKDDIPSLAILYIGEFSQKSLNPVVGLEPDAMQLLKEYPWEYNIIQFKQVINELVTITDTPYITETAVKCVLYPGSHAVTIGNLMTVDLSKSLEEINKEIILAVLKEEDMNQSKAAQRLNISRTTMWRKIK